ncbi:hypothetical protein PV327_007036 [Microctonus hyperodae]|uniref:Uncharacterized protein n=1 Tax=Microctonus hyperodae TaxID=165561 RepID=A0AA39KJ35_MICHY|nr:hypothetical protein PV327_007036 [Microctonus hyperodae]
MDAVDIDTAGSPQNDDEQEEVTVNVCRICLVGNLIMRDLFVDGDVISLSTKAMSFTSVKILPDDGLPSQVCCECADKLESAYDFKLQVEQADSVLRERYDNLHVKDELFFNEVEVDLEGERTESGEIDVDVQYEAAAETLNQHNDSVEDEKSVLLMKDRLTLLQVEKLAAQNQHTLDDTIVHDGDDMQEVIMKEHMLPSDEQYIHDVQNNEQLIGDEIESAQCDDNMKAHGIQEQDSIMIEEHNYMIQQEYQLSSEQEQELMNQEGEANDHDAVEYLSMIGEDESEQKDTANDMGTLEDDKSECINEVGEQEKNDDDAEVVLATRKSRRKSSRRNQMDVTNISNEDNYFENLNLSSRLTQYEVEKSEKIFFMCYMCDKEFLSKDVLKEHMHSHEEVRRALGQKKTLEKSQHKNTSPLSKSQPPSGKKANKCPYCGKEYLYVISFNKHVKQHQKNDDKMKDGSDNLHQSDESIEFEDFDNNDTFEIITDEIVGNEVEYNNDNDGEYNDDENTSGKQSVVEFYKCDKCPEHFVSKLDFKRHAIRHVPQKCNICNEEFDSSEKLRNHRSTHVIEGVITEQDLKDELVSMCDTKEYYGEDGEEQLNQIDDNEPNPMEYSNKESNEFKCPNCSLLFSTKKTLLKHLETHEGVRYRCKICNEKFTRKDHLRKHAEQHGRMKAFKCTECNKTFGNELTLRNHLIATNHKTILQGEEYDPNKRIKRVAAKAAQKIIDKISTEDGLDDSDRDDDNDEFISKVDATGSGKSGERLQTSSRRGGNKKDLECATCGKKCISKQALAKHMEFHVKGEKNEQMEKKKNTESKDNTKNSNTIFGDDRDDDDDDDGDFDGGLDWPMDNHECTTCKKRYSTKKSLLRHQLLHEEPNFECDICNVKFYRKDKLKAHYDKCSEKNPNQVRKCNICGDTFENNEILREHRSKHVDEGILTEEDLRELEPGSEEKKRGEKIARKRRTDIVGLECLECNKQYTSRKGLLRHIQVHEGKKFLCEICPKKFYRREHLKIHVAKHNMIKPYKCSRCSKRFIKEDQLATHMIKHERTFKKSKETNSSAKRFLCEICSKSFTQSTTLVAHLRAHNGIKPYVCEVCARPFTTNAYLKMHMRTHTQERPYTCQYCARAFARADTLANHLTSHTGEAKYHCKYCPKNFRRLKSLKEHVFIHTGQRPYACPTCDRRFNNNGSRYAHSKRCKQNMLQNQMRQTQNETQTTMQTAVVQQPQNPMQQTIRLTQAVGPTMQVVQSKNIKTITITRHPDQIATHQVMQHQDILMPIILPLAVTLADIDEEVILPEGTKIFTTA